MKLFSSFGVFRASIFFSAWLEVRFPLIAWPRTGKHGGDHPAAIFRHEFRIVSRAEADLQPGDCLYIPASARRTQRT